MGLLKRVPWGFTPVLIVGVLAVWLWREAVMLVGVLILLTGLIAALLPKGFWTYGGRSGARSISGKLLLVLLAGFILGVRPWRFLADVRPPSVGSLAELGWIVWPAGVALILIAFLARRRMWVWFRWGVWDAVWGGGGHPSRSYDWPTWDEYEASIPSPGAQVVTIRPGLPWRSLPQLPPHATRGVCVTCGKRCNPDHPQCWECWRKSQ